MKEFIEKLIGRLEEYQENNTQCKSSDDYELGQFNACEYAIEIVNQLAEEYRQDLDKNSQGWISCSERLPEDCTIYEVTARFGNGMCYTEFAYYDESKGEWWKHDDDGLVNVLAWKEHTTPYQPKGE